MISRSSGASPLLPSRIQRSERAQSLTKPESMSSQERYERAGAQGVQPNERGVFGRCVSMNRDEGIRIDPEEDRQSQCEQRNGKDPFRRPEKGRRDQRARDDEYRHAGSRAKCFCAHHHIGQAGQRQKRANPKLETVARLQGSPGKTGSKETSAGWARYVRSRRNTRIADKTAGSKRPKAQSCCSLRRADRSWLHRRRRGATYRAQRRRSESSRARAAMTDAPFLAICVSEQPRGGEEKQTPACARHCAPACKPVQRGLSIVASVPAPILADREKLRETHRQPMTATRLMRPLLIEGSGLWPSAARARTHSPAPDRGGMRRPATEACGPPTAGCPTRGRAART